MASVEEQAIAAINAAETLALSNIRLLEQMKSLLPKSAQGIVQPSIQ